MRMQTVANMKAKAPKNVMIAMTAADDVVVSILTQILAIIYSRKTFASSE